LKHVGQIGALDPIHGDDIRVAVEEVLAHQRQMGMGRDGEQDAGFGQQGVAVVLRGDGPDLQRHDPLVLGVEGLEHLPLTALTDDFDRLVPVPQQLRHQIPRSAEDPRRPLPP